MPRLRVDELKVATPLLFRMEPPRVVVPSRKVTLPVGVPLVAGLTVAVNVTGCPSPDGFTDEISTVVLAASWTVWVAATVCAWKLLSPEYVAEMESIPVVRPLVVTETEPPARVPEPNTVPPFCTVTVPVGSPTPAKLAATVVVNVTD